MALIQKRRTSRNIIAIAIVGAAVVALVVVFQDRIFGGGEAVPATNAPVTTDLPIVEDFGQALFLDPRFTALRSFANTNLDTTERGNEQPFRPF